MYPKVTVNIRAAKPRRGAPSSTGRVFIATTHATTAYGPTLVRSAEEATTAGASAEVSAWVADALNAGAPEVVIVQAADHEAALEQLTSDLGAGQVIAPGVTAAHAELLAHAAATKRTVLLDADTSGDVAATIAAAAGLASAPGSEHAVMVGPAVQLPGIAGAPRNVPASVLAAGLVGARDAATGHANNAPAGPRWGVVDRGQGVTNNYTDAELDSLAAAGVNVFRMVNGSPTLMSWYAVSGDDRWRQANWGRLASQIYTAFLDLGAPFLFEQIDGRGNLFADLESTLSGYLGGLWEANALYGEDAVDAYDVDVRGVNTPTTVAAGELRADIAVWMTGHVEQVHLNVSISTNQEA